MKKIPVPQLAIVLVILNAYIFMGGVMGVTDDPSALRDPNAAGGNGSHEFIDETTAAVTEPEITQTESTARGVDDIPYSPIVDHLNGEEEYDEGKETGSSSDDETTPSSESTTNPETEPPYTDGDYPSDTESTDYTDEPVIDEPSTTIEEPVITEEPALPPEIIIDSEATPEAPNYEAPEPLSEEFSETLTVSDYYSGTISGDALDIVSRTVMTEVGSGFNDEAIKAQAVAAYTNIKNNESRGSTASVILAPQASSRVRSLVKEVLGQAVYYNGSYALTTYYASSAGRTASASNVFNTDYPYLESVETPFDAEYDQYYGSESYFSSDYMRSAIESYYGITLSSNPENWFVITAYEDGQYVGSMSIDGQASCSGRTFRERIMSYKINSAAFKISYDSSSDTFTITTYGKGHGVGMSQWGAQILAEYKGYNYVDILLHYYPGTEVRY